MSIERNLAKLQAAKNRPGDKVPPPAKPQPVPGRAEIEPEGDVDFQRDHQKVFKNAGYATLGLGNDFGRMPQRDMELRSYDETIINMGSVSGTVTLEADRANVFYLALSGDATIAFEVGDRTGVDVSCSLLIDNTGGHAITIEADHWAPRDVEPALDIGGFYEISVAIAVFEETTIIRAFPCIIPDDEV